MTRRGEVRGFGITEEAVARYLPRGYRVVGSYVDDRPGEPPPLVVQIEGEDEAGWTLEDYVAPRLASGLYYVREVSA